MQADQHDARADQPEEDGFTLLELMMVILIIGILIAVMTPIFLGATTRAKDRAMQASLSTATTGAKTFFLAQADYSVATPAAMTAEIGGITFVGGAAKPADQNTVSLFAPPPTVNLLVLSGQSRSGSCFYVLDDESTGTTSYAKLPGVGGCAANGAPLPSDPKWKSAW
jgi:prepilin-type N-terminal cleavage/methylation domain-containing protein